MNNDRRLKGFRKSGGAKAEYKIILCGDGAVGKTTLLNRHLKGIFLKNVRPTIGVNAAVEEVRAKYEDEKDDPGGISKLSGDERVESFTIWDLGGQHLFSQIRPTYMMGANAVMLAFSLNDERSFLDISSDDGVDHSIGQFIKELHSALGAELKKIPTLLVGTKNDLDQKVDPRHVDFVAKKLRKSGMNIVAWSYDEANGLQVYGHWCSADVGGGQYMWDSPNSKRWIPTSSKTGENVSLAFEIIQHSLREMRKVEYLQVSDGWTRRISP